MAILLSEKFGVFLKEWKRIDERIMWIWLKIEGIWVMVVQVYAHTAWGSKMSSSSSYKRLLGTWHRGT